MRPNAMAARALASPRCLVLVLACITCAPSLVNAISVVACAPTPVVTMLLGGARVEVALGTREAGDGRCVSDQPATYVVTALPSRGTLLDAHSLARIITAPYVLAFGVRTRGGTGQKTPQGITLKSYTLHPTPYLYTLHLTP